MEFIREIDIAIVGAGVAGCSVALELSHLGYRDRVVLFEQEDSVLNSFRYYNYYGFGLEFKRLLKGEEYATKYEELLHQEGIDVKLGYKLVSIDDKLLIFETSDGLIIYRANKIVYALGANENKRNDIVDSSIRSVITTKEFWELSVKKELNFKRVVFIGSQMLPLYSAVKAAKESNVEVAAIIEESDDIKSFKVCKYYLEFIKKIPVFTLTKSIKINLRDNKVNGVVFKSHSIRQTVVCDGVVFVGECRSNSQLFEEMTLFNKQSKSLNITQNFQVTNDIFLAGNVIRGSLSSFNSYKEGIKVANVLVETFKNNKHIKSAKIIINYDIDWYYPTMIDIEKPTKLLTKIKLKDRFNGVVKVFLNKHFVMQKEVRVDSFNIVNLGWINVDVKEGDTIEIELEESL